MKLKKINKTISEFCNLIGYTMGDAVYLKKPRARTMQCIWWEYSDKWFANFASITNKFEIKECPWVIERDIEKLVNFYINLGYEMYINDEDE